MGRVVALGSSNTDLVLRLPRLPAPGETILGGEFAQVAGGKGANQAVAAARAGAEVLFVAALGEDAYGDDAFQRLSAEGLDLTHLRRIAGQSSGLALIFVEPGGRNMIGVAPGANNALTPADVAAIPDSAFAAPGAFLAPLESPLETVHAGLSRAKMAGLTTVFNPAPANPRVADREWLSLVDVLVVNEPEAGLLTGCIRRLDTRRELENAASTLLSWGAVNVIITLGEAGYLMAANSAMEIHPARETRAIDTVAAGDTFVGYLAAGLASGMNLVASAARANLAAAYAVTRTGAQNSIPHARDLEKFDPPPRLMPKRLVKHGR